jgi:hypothetical protein
VIEKPARSIVKIPAEDELMSKHDPADDRFAVSVYVPAAVRVWHELMFVASSGEAKSSGRRSARSRFTG